MKDVSGMAGEVYRLLCGGVDDRGGYFSSGDHDDYLVRTDFRRRIMCRLLYDRIYYEKYLGDLIGENMIQWGVAGIFCGCHGRVCLFFFRRRGNIWI